MPSRIWWLAVLGSGCMGVVDEVPMETPALPSADSGMASLVDAGVAPDGGEGVDAGAMVVDAGVPQDAGATVVDAGSPMPDAGRPGVPVFILVGKQGRRAISCDEGRSWRNDVSFDDALPMNLRYRCFSGNFALPDGGTNNTDCDHNAWSSTSLSFTGEAFLQTLGWGAPGTFWRSTDGLSWSLVHSGANVSDVMVGPTRLIAATRSSRRSDDRGLTWTNGPELRLQSGSNDIWNVRGGAYGGGSFVVSAQDGMNVDWQVSRDEGATWQRPQLVGGGRIDACGSAHPVYGNGTFVSATWTGSRLRFCRSVDQGLTWTVIDGPTDYPESRVVFTGAGFMIWSNGKVHRSIDGASWTTMNTSTRSPTGMMSSGPNPGPVAVNGNGTFVAVRGGWNVWYDQQRFYRSTDGVVWDELPDTAYRRGHPVTAIVSGFAPASSCP